MTVHVSIRDQLAKFGPYTVIGDLEYEFEELEIEISEGFRAGCFDGMAEIDIMADGGFQIDAIWIDARKLTPGKCEYSRVKLEAREHPQLWSAIERRLQSTARDSVESYIDGMGA